MTQAIIDATEAALGDLIATFRSSSTLFYTENDLVCWFAAMLNEKLGGAGIVEDKDKLPHRLVHTEYPTPFRCSMANGGFVTRTVEDCRRDGKRYKRGHLDIVVLNPEFVAGHTYAQLNGQNLALLQAEVFGTWTGSMLVYAIEFFLSRSVINPGTVPRKVREIEQDAAKLEAAGQWNEFVKKTRHVAFLKGAGDEGERLVREKLAGKNGIELVFTP